MYLSAPLVFGFLARYPRSKRPSIVVGLVVMCMALGLSSLSQTVTHLIISQGVFYAIGGSLCYSPTIQFMDEWFVKRKGLAFGVMWVGRVSIHFCSIFSYNVSTQEYLRHLHIFFAHTS